MASAGVVERPGLKPQDSIEPIRNALEQAGGDVMVVGHLPFLGRLAGVLTVGHQEAEVVKFAYGGVVCLERGEKGFWRAVWIVTPELLQH